MFCSLHTAGVASSKLALPTIFTNTERYQPLKFFSEFTFQELGVCFPRKHFFARRKATPCCFRLRANSDCYGLQNFICSRFVSKGSKRKLQKTASTLPSGLLQHMRCTGCSG